MPLNFSNDRLLGVVRQWPHGAIILVDESTADADISQDRAARHRIQSALLVRAATYGLRVFVVKYGANGAHGQHQPFGGGLSAELNAAIPGGTNEYEKGNYEQNGFDNLQLGVDVQAQNISDVIIMGQSVNACCAATARGAAALGINVHTCESLIRGGGVATAPLQHFPGVGFAGWPNGTTIYAAV